MKINQRFHQGCPYPQGLSNQTTEGGQQKWPPVLTVMKTGLPKCPPENLCHEAIPAPPVPKAFHHTSMGLCPPPRALHLILSMSAAKLYKDKIVKDLPTGSPAFCQLLKMVRRPVQRTTICYQRDLRIWTSMRNSSEKQRKGVLTMRFSPGLVTAQPPQPQ